MTTENFKSNSFAGHQSLTSLSTKPLVIIPAAGYGSRVGSPEAKELLLNDIGEPLIALALNQARDRQWPVHVITRKEKQSLITYLKTYSDLNQREIQIQLIEPSQEWPDTVLQSRDFWRDQNILCLPDTIFKPLDIWDSLNDSLTRDGDIALAVFEPGPDYAKWGVVRFLNETQIEICEKPRARKENLKAWGLSAFTCSGGLELLKAQMKSTFDHNWISLKSRAHLIELDDFKDLTRS